MRWCTSLCMIHKRKFLLIYPSIIYYKSDGYDAMEGSISGNGCRPSNNAMFYGNALAISRIAAATGNTNEWAERADTIRTMYLKLLWNTDVDFFTVYSPLRGKARRTAPTGCRLGSRMIYAEYPTVRRCPSHRLNRSRECRSENCSVLVRRGILKSRQEILASTALMLRLAAAAAVTKMPITWQPGNNCLTRKDSKLSGGPPRPSSVTGALIGPKPPTNAIGQGHHGTRVLHPLRFFILSRGYCWDHHHRARQRADDTIPAVHPHVCDSFYADMRIFNEITR